MFIFVPPRRRSRAKHKCCGTGLNRNDEIRSYNTRIFQRNCSLPADRFSLKLCLEDVNYETVG